MLNRVLWIFVACAFTAAMAVADEKTANDAKHLQGAWQAVDLEANGEKSPADQVTDLKLLIKADEVVVRPDGKAEKCKFKLDSSKTPKTIDLVPLDGPSKGKTVVGIYSLKDGRLMMCINLFGQDPALRPAEFKTRERDGVGLVTLERAKASPPTR